MHHRRPPRPRTVDDAGSALITVLLALALLTALATTVAAVTISNLQSTHRAAASARALNAADAGADQALTYLKTYGVQGLQCTASASSTSADCTKPYGSGSPVTVALPGGAAQYRVWIEQVAAFAPQTQTDGLYAIHSTGTADDAAQRSVIVKVQVSAASIPHSMFAFHMPSTGLGAATVQGVSLFTTDCVEHRGQLPVSGIDSYFGIPAGVHSTDMITTANDCTKKNASSIHTAAQPCSSQFPNDQDAFGASLGVLPSTSGCPETLAGTSSTVMNKIYGPSEGASDLAYGSKLVPGALESDFGLPDNPLSNDQLARLKSIAVADGTYYDQVPSGTWPSTAAAPRGVFYFDLAHPLDGNHDVRLEDVPEAFKKYDGTTCRPAVVVIKNGNASLHKSAGGADSGLFGALYLMDGPTYGSLTINGGTINGSVFAYSLSKFNGNVTLTQEPCAFSNVNPALLSIATISYREVG